MTTCWKCGQPTTNNSSECDACATAAVFRVAPAAPPQMKYEVDWSKINTLEEMRAFISEIIPAVFVPTGLALPASFKRFLKSPEQPL